MHTRLIRAGKVKVSPVHMHMKEMKAPSNTTREANDNPMAALFYALPGGIEAQESRGQRELVNSDTLPADCRDKAAFERMGIKFGDPVPGDHLFVYAELTKGWSKKGTDHPMRQLRGLSSQDEGPHKADGSDLSKGASAQSVCDALNEFSLCCGEGR